MIPQPRDYANDRMDYQQVFRHWYSTAYGSEMSGDGYSCGHPYRFGGDEFTTYSDNDSELQIVGLL